jgi:hypothetical protein
MAKQSGLGMTTLSVDDSGGSVVALVNDITNFEMATPRGVQETTGLDKSAMERILLLADASITLNGPFNPTASTSSHAVFRTVPSSSVARTVTVAHASQTLAGEYLFTDYALTRAASGELTWTAPGVLSNGTVPTWA